MLHFFENEKSAIVCVVEAMVLIDGEVHKKEMLFNMLILSKLDIKEEQFDQGSKCDLSVACRILRAMSSGKKKLVSAMLGVLLSIDGDINEKELMLWRTVSTACEFPTMSILDAKEYFTDFLSER